MNRFFTQFLAACLMASTSLIVAAAQQPPGTSSDELVRAALQSLQKADTDRLGELWESGSSVLKSRVPKTTFIETTRKARLSMGPVTARDWSSVARLQYRAGNESGFPAGLYANVDLVTQLGNGKSASERISFAMENNSWRFTGYVIAPPTPSSATPAAPLAPATSSAPATRTTQLAPSSASDARAPEVEAAVHAWAAAWSARDVGRYLLAYAPEFTPANRQQSRKNWEEERRARIAGKSTISVTVQGLAISIDGQTATARFRQTYRANDLSEVGRKTLEFQRSGTQWLIRKETAGV
ncbi:ketosteroid isomerase-like protein [Variovorax boronicumulans]|uniref:DUF4019 domain-containing protein n=1 Tax=Variovorax TaxID=34072 RepID=UPI00278AA2E0|nr:MULTISPECIES: DUF4019 domain-containing protein [Variovorax]MDQ0037064.1 ketosteroid isomerase-like protein [Variovorax boronicumulans]MDQ0611081.1 ketosteroid isomerase-like protein [Variovorax sp. W1I1]